MEVETLRTVAWKMLPYAAGFLAARVMYKWLLRYRSPIAALKYSFEGKTVLITGASQGVGRALAWELHKRGARLFLLARSIDALNQLCDELKAAHPNNKHEPNARYIDMAEPNGIEDLIQSVKSVGGIDILVNNAGIAVHASAAATTIEAHRRAMQVNYFGAIELTQTLLPHINNGGCIVAVTSIQARFAIPQRSAYGATKHAMLVCLLFKLSDFLTQPSKQAYFDSLRAELQGRVQVLDVEPSYIATNLGVNSWSGSGQPRNKGNDECIKSGMTPEYVARRIVQGIVCGEHEVMLAPLLHRLVHCVRFLMPNLYFFVMQRRDQMQCEKED